MNVDCNVSSNWFFGGGWVMDVVTKFPSTFSSVAGQFEQTGLSDAAERQSRRATIYTLNSISLMQEGGTIELKRRVPCRSFKGNLRVMCASTELYKYDEESSISTGCCEGA